MLKDKYPLEDFDLVEELNNQVAEAISGGVLLQSSGKLTFLRVHDVGTGWGPPSDFIDVEVVIRLDSRGDEAFGFQLRNDQNLPARQGMLDLLRDAFSQNSKVTIDYDIDPGKKNGIIIRTALAK